MGERVFGSIAVVVALIGLAATAGWKFAIGTGLVW